MTDTFERLCAVLVEHHHLAIERLTPDAPLESLGIDSLGTVELLWNVEDAFQIKLPERPVELVTLADVVVFIDGLVALRIRAAARAASAARWVRAP